MKTTDKSIQTIFFAHHLWTNLRLIEVCQTLTDEQLTHVAAGTFGSIRETLAHIVRAEERYLTFLIGQEFTNVPKPDATTPLEELRDRAQQSGIALQTLAGQKPPDQEVKVGDSKEAEMLPAQILFLQAIHHAQEHRTQVATILGQLGIEPPNLSGWDYYDQVIASTE